ncbi:MAG: NifU family protein [Phycisphaerae bacterium]|nr:NifU family protein [Phycisphaerae bacterium]NUQ45055.1 NifU family protein [Phycisphaerae bacterium]
MKARVQEVLALIRPAVQMDGGDLEFVGVDDDGIVSVRLHGACVGCPSSAMTLKMGIERHLREKIPEVREVICV